MVNCVRVDKRWDKSAFCTKRLFIHYARYCGGMVYSTISICHSTQYLYHTLLNTVKSSAYFPTLATPLLIVGNMAHTYICTLLKGF